MVGSGWENKLKRGELLMISAEAVQGVVSSITSEISTAAPAGMTILGGILGVKVVVRLIKSFI
jgi:uncharacterized protein YaiE (UPF0345 family)